MTVLLAAITLMWVFVALGPDSLLSTDCSSIQRSCVESHSGAAIWAIFTGVLAILFGISTVRRYLKTRRGDRPDSAGDG